MLIGANLILNDTTLPMRQVAPMVEEAGLDALFIGEHTHMPVATTHPAMPGQPLPDFYRRFLDPFVQLTAAATVTSRIRLGLGVVLVAERNPLELAKAVASLDQVADGRVDVGVGLGWNRLEMRNNGVDPARRRAVFREKLAAVLRLWTEDTVAVDGEFVSFTESWSYPKPVQRPHPPVLIGASASPATFADVAALGDGWYPLATPELPADMVRLASACGGDRLQVTAVEMDGQRPGAPWAWQDPDAAERLGTTARCYAEAGLDRLIVGVPAGDSRDLERALEHLAGLRAELW